MALLFKLLKKNVSWVQLIGFLLVNIVGGVIVLAGVQARADFNRFSDGGDQLLSSGYVVVSKPVTAVSTVSSLLGLKPSFSDREIEELEALSSVASVGAFVSADFDIRAALAIGEVRIRTDIFLEAVPDKFIKNDFKSVGGVKRPWSASLESDTVPIIIPRNYYNLYNYGFAASHGLPQISDEFLGKFPIKLYINDGERVVEYDAVVCGLTNKLNTILVPIDFMEAANAAYAPDTHSSPSRLILATDASEAEESLFDYLDENGYVVEGDSSHVRLQTFMYTLLAVVIAVGFVFSLLAFFLLLISVVLLIEKNKEKVGNLYSIGYSEREISRVYQLPVIIADVSVWTIAAVAAMCIYPSFSGLLINVSPGFRPCSMLVMAFMALVLALLFSLLHVAVIYRQVKRHCK